MNHIFNMDKEEKVENLEKMESLIGGWLELRKKGGDHGKMQDCILEMAKLWGIVSEILKGLDYNLEIELFDPSRSKSIKPRMGDIFHNGIFSASHNSEQFTNMATMHSYVLSAIEKTRKGLIVRENILPTVNVLLNILGSFPDVVSRLKYRRPGKETLLIKDEYDVQDIVYIMLKGIFPTLQYEDPMPKVGLNSSRADFTIIDLGVFLETKIISKKGKEKEIQQQCLTDIQNYGKQEGCQKIIFFIYDPEKCIDNQYAFKNGIGNNCSFEEKSIEIITLIFN